jgi:HK97 family phage major capsid protein
MNLQEQQRAFQQKRNEAIDRQTQIMELAGTEGRTLDDEESAEYDGLTKELSHIEKHLERISVLASDTPSNTQKAVSKGPTIIVKRTDPDDEFIGQSFVRRVIAKAASHLSDGEMTPVEVAKHRWGQTHPNLVNWIAKAAVAGGITHTNADWAANLVQSDNRYTGDFIEYLKSLTIYDRLPLREIPAHVTVKGQDGIATGYWVGEGRPIPASKQSFTSVGLKPLKVAALSVITNELIMHSSPSAEMLVRDGLAEASSQTIDETFLGAGAADANVAPAGMLNGVTAISASGTTADALRADINSLYAQFLADKNAAGLHFVTAPTLGKQIGLMRNALGQREFESLGAMGGTLEGDPLHTGDNVSSDSTGTHLILLKPSDIYRIGDMGVQVSLSRDATIEQATNPAGRADTGVTASQSIVSMFQTESTAFKVVRAINFAKRRTNAVQYIDDADYGAVGS